jgi:L-lactate utilization protein LutB/heterodisulfide reductase subunit B
MDPSDRVAELQQKLADALSDFETTEARNNALCVIREKHAASAIDADRLKQDFKEVKDRCIDKLDELIPKAVAKLEANGCHVHLVRGEEDLTRELLDILSQCTGSNIIVKSKINTGKEVHLVENLEASGYEVIETDLGDRIVQLLDYPASHPLLPALQVPKQRVARLFGLDEPEKEYTTKEIVDVASHSLRDLIAQARAGLTGANAICAEEGFICLCENEGNQRLVTSLPKLHIVIAGMDKVVENAVDALKVVKAATYFGLGEGSVGYISFIMGPSRTGDIAFEVTMGMHGPEQVHVFLINNRREEILASPFKEILECVSCGGCVNYCPVYRSVGGIYGDGGGGRRVIFTGLTDTLDHAFLSGANFCTSCGACVQHCPAGIDVPALMPQFRQKIVDDGIALDSHVAIAQNIEAFNNPFGEIAPRDNWIVEGDSIHVTPGARNLFFVGCMGSFRMPQQARDTAKLLDYLGMEYVYLGVDEPCCGGILRRVGFENQFLANQTKVEAAFAPYEEIWVLCPGCYSTFVDYYGDFLAEHGIKIRHVIEILAEHADQFPASTEVVTYHDPCHIARTHNIVDPPRQILAQVSDLREMPYHGNSTQCCGAGGGCLSAFSDLAADVAAYRVKDALATGAQYLLTVCPFCEYNLARCEDAGIKVGSVQHFLAEKVKQ